MTTYPNDSHVLAKFFERRHFMLFSGSYDRTLDAKKRIIMPPKIRDDLGTRQIVLFADPDEECIRVYREEQWEDLAEKILYAEDGDSDADKQRDFFFYSEKCEIDSQSRFVLPAKYIEAAGIEKDIVILGLGRRVEIWAKERLEKVRENSKHKVKFKLPY